MAPFLKINSPFFSPFFPSFSFLQLDGRWAYVPYFSLFSIIRDTHPPFHQFFIKLLAPWFTFFFPSSFLFFSFFLLCAFLSLLTPIARPQFPLLSPTPNFHRPLLDFYFGLAIWLARS